MVFLCRDADLFVLAGRFSCSLCSLWQTCAQPRTSPSVARWTWLWEQPWRAWDPRWCWAPCLSTSPASSKFTSRQHKRRQHTVLRQWSNWSHLLFTFLSDDLEFPRSWLIPVVRDHVRNTRIAFFTSYFLPLASTLKQKGKCVKLHEKEMLMEFYFERFWLLSDSPEGWYFKILLCCF